MTTTTDKTPSLTELHDALLKKQRADAARHSAAYRARAKAAAANGSPLPRPADVRDALADAALVLLATDAPGSGEVKRLLTIAFGGKPMVAINVAANAKAGRLRPKRLTPEVLKAAAPKVSPFKTAIADVEAAQRQARLLGTTVGDLLREHGSEARVYGASVLDPAVEETLDAYLLETGDLSEVEDEARRRVDKWQASQP